jgi:hypothetical protein
LVDPERTLEFLTPREHRLKPAEEPHETDRVSTCVGLLTVGRDPIGAAVEDDPRRSTLELHPKVAKVSREQDRGTIRDRPMAPSGALDQLEPSQLLKLKGRVVRRRAPSDKFQSLRHGKEFEHFVAADVVVRELVLERSSHELRKEALLPIRMFLEGRRGVTDPDVRSAAEAHRDLDRSCDFENHDRHPVALQVAEAHGMPLWRQPAFQPKLERQLTDALGGRVDGRSDDLAGVRDAPDEETTGLVIQSSAVTEGRRVLHPAYELMAKHPDAMAPVLLAGTSAERYFFNGAEIREGYERDVAVIQSHTGPARDLEHAMAMLQPWVDRARQIVREQRPAIETIAAELMTVDCLSRELIDDLIERSQVAPRYLPSEVLPPTTGESEGGTA